MPLSLMLMNKDATVTVCHIKTKNLKMHTKNADILFCACGVPHLINKQYLKKDVVIIDVGINKIPVVDIDVNVNVNVNVGVQDAGKKQKLLVMLILMMLKILFQQ